MNRQEVIINLRQILIRRRDILNRALADDLQLLGEIPLQVFSDEPALDYVRENIISQLVEIESKILTRIEYALERMKKGLYGICENCGTIISISRLNALPYTTLCIKCQHKLECQSDELENQENESADKIFWDRLADSSDSDNL